MSKLHTAITFCVATYFFLTYGIWFSYDTYEHTCVSWIAPIQFYNKNMKQEKSFHMFLVKSSQYYSGFIASSYSVLENYRSSSLMISTANEYINLRISLKYLLTVSPKY